MFEICAKHIIKKIKKNKDEFFLTDTGLTVEDLTNNIWSIFASLRLLETCVKEGLENDIYMRLLIGSDEKIYIEF